MRLALVSAILLLVNSACAFAQGIPEELSEFPYPLVRVAGNDAFQEWGNLRRPNQTPIIIGALEDVLHVQDDMAINAEQSVNETLLSASSLSFPQAIYDHRLKEVTHLIEQMGEGEERRKENLAAYIASGALFEVPDAMLGAFEQMPALPQEFISLNDFSTGQPHSWIYIALLPTDKPYTAPAYLKSGNWNANPPAQVHVAALKSFYEQYGAVPVVMNSSTYELLVQSTPQTEAEAMELAKHQYVYCGDIVLQGVQTIGNLASLRAASKVWYFWWD